MASRAAKARFFRFTKWSGVVFCALLLLAWYVSMFSPICKPCGNHLISLKDGKFRWIHFKTFYYDNEEKMWIWDFPFSNASIVVPLLVPFFIVAGMSAVLFWLNRRVPREGHCKHCDYDLSGNISGRCPECGNSTQTETG